MHTQDYIELENQYNAHNYHPLDVVIERAEGVMVYNPEGEAFFDMLSAYSALNFGHRHPEIIEAAKDQLARLSISARDIPAAKQPAAR